MNNLANFLTVLSLLFGFMSIIFSLEAHFTFASWAIILSVILDGLDGQVARRNPVPSDFGKELDSLVDVASFGIAPAILGYTFIYSDFYASAAVALFVYLLCSVLRLARYNITPKEKMVNYFYGLPTTASGGILASFILIFRNKASIYLPRYVPILFIFLVLLLAFLMVSRVRYLNLDGLKELFGKKAGALVAVLAVLMALALITRKAGTSMFALFLIYLIFSPLVVKRLNGAHD